jgi:signal transduction histidine kinase
LIAVSAPWFDVGRFGGVIQATIPLGTLMPASGDVVAGICHAVVDDQGGIITADPCFPRDALLGLDGRALRDQAAAGFAVESFALHRSPIRNRPGWSVISAVSGDGFSLDHGFVVATGALVLLACMLVLAISLRLTWRHASASLERLSRTLRDVDMQQPARTRELLDQLPVDSREVAMIQHAVVELIDRVAFVAALESDNRKQREAHTEQLANALVERDALVAARTEDLRAALEEATAADRAKSRLLANASHELRTPLYGIVGTAELLALRLNTDADRRACRTILSCAESMQHLISDLLTLGRLDQGQAALLAVEFDVGVEVAAALDALRPAATAAGLYLRLDSEHSSDWRRVGDPLRVREIVSNLVGNAIKFTDHGGVNVVIDHGEDGALRIDVTDTGRGIEQKHVRSIFEPFWQADAADNRHTQGVGLGLAIVRHWAVAMGGDVSVRSTPARGSTFSLHLPLPLARSATAVETSPAAPLSLMESSRRVLVVDDIALNRQVLSSQLRVLGFTRIAEAADGFDALSRIHDQEFDLVLLDCQMPGMDGYETATRIRDMLPGSPVRIIAVTAAAGQDESERCLSAGMDGYVAKPVDLATLQRAVAIDPGEV